MDNYNTSKKQSTNTTVVTVLVLLLLLTLGFFIFRAFAGDTLNTMLGTNMSTSTNENQMNDSNTNDDMSGVQSTSDSASQTNPGVTSVSENSNTPDTNTDQDKAFAIKVADLSTEQQAMLSSTGFGVDDEIIITNKMKTCAETSIGVERTKALTIGEKPTFIEGAKLLVCYNQ